MVEADQAQQGPDVISGPDDLAFVEAPPKERKLKRSNTAGKKPEAAGGLMGFIGSLRRNTRPEIPERRKSRSHREEDGRHADPERDEVRRQRREDRKRRSMKPETDGEGFTTDPPLATGALNPGAEDPEASKAARKARRASRHGNGDQFRESELREAEERRARRKEKERAREERERQAREEEEEKRREEKRARRAAREERRAREEQEAKEAEARAEAKAEERRERRRLRDQEMHESSKARQRQSRAGDWVERSGDEGEKSKHRRSKFPAEAMREVPTVPGNKHQKISSWVDSQADDPPEPPPITATVIDMPPPPGEQLNTHSVSSDDEARRDLRRRARRRAKYPGLTDEEIDDMRARRRRGDREGMKSSSGSADHDRDRGYGPPPGPKMSNWFRKLTNL